MTPSRSMALGVALVTILASGSARAESDLQLWFEAGIAKKLDKRFTLSLDQHLRFDQDVSRLQAVMPELAVTYRAHKRLRLAAGYRFIYERNNDGVLVVRHRGFVDARPRYVLGPVEISYRLRFQEEVRGSFAADDLRHTLRNRLAVQVRDVEPWVPAVAAETFHRLGDGEAIRLQKIRLTAGVGYRVGDHEVEVFYRVEVAQDDPADPTPHILGLGYHYDL